MAIELRTLMFRLEIDNFSDFANTSGQQRTSHPVAFHQLAWNIRVVNVYNCLNCYVHCNGGNGLAPADWSYVANVICNVSVKPCAKQIASAYQVHTFSASNSECGLLLGSLSGTAMQMANELNGTFIVEALIIPKPVLRQEESIGQIHANVQGIQEASLNSIADPKIGRVETVSECWNVAEIEGSLEFFKNGRLTSKDSDYGLIRAMESLPSKELGILYFELKIIKFPRGCRLQIGITQKTNELNSFHIFTPIYELIDKNGMELHGGRVICCGLKMSKGELYFTNDGELEKTAHLNELKLGKGVDMAFAVKTIGLGCCIQLSQIKESEDENDFIFDFSLL